MNLKVKKKAVKKIFTRLIPGNAILIPERPDLFHSLTFIGH